MGAEVSGTPCVIYIFISEVYLMFSFMISFMTSEYFKYHAGVTLGLPYLFSVILNYQWSFYFHIMITGTYKQMLVLTCSFHPLLFIYFHIHRGDLFISGKYGPNFPLKTLTGFHPVDSYNHTLSFISSVVFGVQSFIIPSDVAGNALAYYYQYFTFSPQILDLTGSYSNGRL